MENGQPTGLPPCPSLPAPSLPPEAQRRNDGVQRQTGWLSWLERSVEITLFCLRRFYPTLHSTRRLILGVNLSQKDPFAYIGEIQRVPYSSVLVPLRLLCMCV